MELVYLWVEEYRNIKEQGFNFSGRYRCRFDCEWQVATSLNNGKEHKNVTGGNLHIAKLDDCNIFPQDINVEAIIGKNGSSKTSLLKLILYAMAEKTHFDHSTQEFKAYCDFLSNKFFFLIFVDSNKNFFYLGDLKISNKHSLCIKTMFDGQEIELKKFENQKKIFSTYFNYSLETIDQYDEKSGWLNVFYHKADNYRTPILIQPNKTRGNGIALKRVIDIDLENYLTRQRMLLLLASKTFFGIYKNNFFEPNKIKMVVNYEKLQRIPRELHSIYSNDKTDDGEIMLEHSFLEAFEMQNIADKGLTFEKIRYLNAVYIIKKALGSDYQDTLQIKQKFLKEYTTPRPTLDIQTYLSEIDKIAIQNEHITYAHTKLVNALKFNAYLLDKQGAVDFINTEEAVDVKIIPSEVLELTPPIFDIELYDGNRGINSLSSGEKQLLFIQSNMIYQIKNITEEGYTAAQFLFDEIELNLHPEWQRTFLSNLINIFKNLNNKPKITLIFASHSPFLLSDIPSDNIIFLDRDSNGKCIVVDGLKDKKQTFGANIHTLLSDAFFMEDGLMGEHAKTKINELINYLNNKESTIKENDDAQKYINIIGEPILKRQLQKMLDSKRLAKVDKIDVIEKQIALLKQELEQVKLSDKNSQ